LQYETDNFYSIVALILLEVVKVRRGIDGFGWNAVAILLVRVSGSLTTTMCAMSSTLCPSPGATIDSAMLMLVHEVGQVWRATTIKHLLRALTSSSPAKAKQLLAHVFHISSVHIHVHVYIHIHIDVRVVVVIRWSCLVPPSTLRFLFKFVVQIVERLLSM